MIPVRSLILVALLSGCVSSPNTSATSGQPQSAEVAGVPLNVAQTRDTYFADNPAAQSFAFLDRSGKGFRFNRDGSLDYIAFGARSNLTTRTTLSEIAGNRFCMDPAGSWTGGCATLTGTLEGPISGIVTFGNGATRRVTLQFTPA